MMISITYFLLQMCGTLLMVGESKGRKEENVKLGEKSGVKGEMRIKMCTAYLNFDFIANRSKVFIQLTLIKKITVTLVECKRHKVIALTAAHMVREDLHGRHSTQLCYTRDVPTLQRWSLWFTTMSGTNVFHISHWAFYCLTRIFYEYHTL